MTRWMVVALMVAVAAVTGCSTAGDDDGVAAEVMCEEFVKDRLKAPGSADFSDQEHEKVGDGWRVTGVVDSENSFGANLRAEYSCELEHEGDEWTASSVVVRPR